MNPAALAIHGFQSMDSFERPFDRMTASFELFDLAGERLPRNQWPVSRVLRGESFLSYRVRVHRRDNGHSFFGSYGGTPIFDENGQLLLALVTMRDVTQELEAQQALQQSRDELEQRVSERTAELEQRANQLAQLASELTLAEDRERRHLAQFLHGNLQQLLVGAKFGLHRLARQRPEAQRSDFGEVENLLNEAISASRSLTMELSPPILHEAGLSAGLDWLVRWMKKTHDLTVELEMDPDFNIEREDLRLLIFQAVRELLFNVTKHAKTDRARVTVSGGEDQLLEIVVEDQGAGFDPAAMTEGQDRTSTGFGLFSMQERLDLLGGRLRIESAPGRGSRFTVTAPLQPGDRAANRDTPAPPTEPALPQPETSVAPISGRIRLLLVDDHAVVRQGISMLLASEKDVQIVGQADNGVVAVKLCRRLHPDVVLMDSSMPTMDGVEATRVIHKELPETRIIGLSMYEEADRARAMLDAGATTYLSKTGKSDTLIATIRKVAGNPLPNAA